MIIIPNTVRIACCASGQKWSPLDQPNLPPHPNQPPPPASPPPPTSSLCLISLFHFSNSLFFPPSAPSKAFLARSCNHRHSKANIINLQYKQLNFTMYNCLILISQDFCCCSTTRWDRQGHYIKNKSDWGKRSHLRV